MTPETAPSHTRNLTITAWAATIIASILPEIIFNQTGSIPAWLFWVKLGLFGGLLVLSLLWRKLLPLRSFFAVWLVLIGGTQLAGSINFNLPALQKWLGGGSFVQTLQPLQLSKLAVTAAVLATLMLFGKTRKQVFLTPGKLGAPIQPVKWLGFPNADSWWRFGGQYGFYIPLGMALVAWLMSRPSSQAMEKVLPLLPAILLFAALNAFNEEVALRASLLAALEPVTGSLPAWWMSALYFGIAHFYGVPYGWLGIALATFNGWLLGKAMLETRGLAWAWWMHFLQDVAIFVFLAAGAITPGG